MMRPELLKKYDIPAPRYTSYPTVPYWSDAPTTEEWLHSLKDIAADPKMSWALYVHIPFCETLCTFCGCNTTITRNHKRSQPYLDLLLKEIDLYQKQVPQLFERPLRQFHFGGGTPTFFSAEELTELVHGVDRFVARDHRDFEGSIEVDPRRTTPDQLKALYDLGFRRVSMGVQDFNHEVQRLINRIQPFEITRDLTEQARQMGYDSVNFDLIYGLPKQSLPLMEKTVEQTIELRPDRIALYSFALVPWIKPAQRLFKDEDLPVGAEKRALYERAYQMLTGAGYVEIGMDHFALPEDSLTRSMNSGGLHRNFMGYTDARTEVLLGLGVSSISESPTCFHQNEKVLPVYEKRIGEGEIPTLRGHKLSEEDQRHRELILQFMTSGHVELTSDEMALDVGRFLSELIEDGLVRLDGHDLRLTEDGKPFLRNACMALDKRLRDKAPQTRVFSKSL